MDQEFKRTPGNTAIHAQGFEVSVNGGSEITVVYSERGREASIPAERTRTGGIGLFMNWAQFPEGAGADERCSIFERVVQALWFLEIRIDWTEIHDSENLWPLPQRSQQ